MLVQFEKKDGREKKHGKTTIINRYIKGAVTDMRYIGRSKFSRSLVYKKKFSLI